MTTRDPFLHAIVIVADRIAVLVCLAAVGSTLLWDIVCRFAFGPPGLAFQLAIEVLTGRAGRVAEAVFALTLAFAAISTTLLSFGLFALWRRRARLNAGHLRGSQQGV